MTRNITETLVGAVVLAAAGGFLYFAGHAVGASVQGDEYTLTANFRSVEGLNVGSDVRMSGVKVGTLTKISLDPVTYKAITEISVDNNISIPDDADIKVASDGLLGGAFLEITAGGSPFMLEDGGEIIFTQGSISFLNLLMKFATSDDE